MTKGQQLAELIEDFIVIKSRETRLADKGAGGREFASLSALMKQNLADFLDKFQEPGVS